MTKLRAFLAMTLVSLLLSSAAGASRFKVLHNFGATGDGASPAGPPLLTGTGLYGITAVGGTSNQCEYGCGTAYHIRSVKGGFAYSVIYDFSYAFSTNPDGDLVADTAGNLYGTALGFGSIVFELQTSMEGWSFSSIYDGGAEPGLTIDASGNIFGVIGGGVNNGAGALGELSPLDGGWNYTTLYSFCSQPKCADGAPPYNPVSMDEAGNLYGTTYDAGFKNEGIAYQLNRGTDPATGATTWTYYIMHSFGISELPDDGRNPNGGLTEDRSGNAFGTTPVGGQGCPFPGCGTVFELSPNPYEPGIWREKILYDFPGDTSCAQGCAPAYNLVFDKAGNLYGINGGGLTCPGGAPCGMVYKLTPTESGPWIYTIVHEFNGDDGEYPIGLAIDGRGNLFGTTQRGGRYGSGVVFEITP